jgi:phage terminase large subunit-like protein
VFQYVPRKNGKSTMLGGLMNLVAFCDDEPGAQIYSAAAEREQAALVYRQAKGMILNNPELAEAHVKIYATFKSIEYPAAWSTRR